MEREKRRAGKRFPKPHAGFGLPVVTKMPPHGLLENRKGTRKVTEKKLGGEVKDEWRTESRKNVVLLTPRRESVMLRADQGPDKGFGV